jgi:hypothetical protein
VTFPDAEKVVSRLERWAGRIILFLVLGTCLCFAGLVYLQVRVSGQASEGQKARATQCRTFPIALKLYAAAAKYRLITAADLRTYRAAAPRGCPAPTPEP